MVSKGYEIDRMVEHLNIDELKSDDIVFGTLPIHMVANLNQKNIRYFHLILSLPPEQRGIELSTSMMDESGARLEEYVVTKKE